MPKLPVTLAQVKVSGPISNQQENRLTAFLRGISAEGKALVVNEPLSSNLDEESLNILRLMDAQAREEAALEIPFLNVEASHWAARLFYRLCQSVVNREIDDQQIKVWCDEACPGTRSPEIDWSVDLVFRHLPELFGMARHLSFGDPLVRHLKGLAATWPFSSVGIPGVQGIHIDSFVSHRAMRRLYADRILIQSDISRLADGTIAELLKSDLRMFPDLSPVLASKLFSNAHDPA